MHYAHVGVTCLSRCRKNSLSGATQLEPTIRNSIVNCQCIYRRHVNTLWITASSFSAEMSEDGRLLYGSSLCL